MALQDRREAQAHTELGHTRITTGWARCLIVLFLAPLVLVPVVRELGEEPARAAWVDFFTALPTTIAAGGPWAVNRGVLGRMEQLESRLESSSPLHTTEMPVVQAALLAGGVGNETVYPGHAGWLFLRDGVDYVLGVDPQTDAVPVILDFAEQLNERGIELVVAPIPTKAMIEPGAFVPGVRADPGALHHPALYERLRDELESAGVTVVDLVSPLAELDRAAFLRTDSHWTPAGMVAAAETIAEVVAPRLDGGAELVVDETLQPIEHRGDLWQALRLPDGHRWWMPPAARFEPDRIEHRRVDVAGQPWRSAEVAEVVLIGDSFTNVFDRIDGWGESGGLGAHLARGIERPVSVFAVDAGATVAARRQLARHWADRPEAMTTTKVVVWSFAVRELVVGDWRNVDLPEATERVTAESTVELDEPIDVVVEAVAPIPPPEDTPYSEALVALRLELPSGEAIIGFAWAIRERERTEAARLGPGDRLTVTLADLDTELGGVQRFELTDPESLLLDAYVMELWEKR